MIYHILPVDDKKAHSEDSAFPCACNPKIITENGDMILVHNSWDGREAVEEAERILGGHS